MERTKVSSSTIASIGYEDSTSTLEIEFKNGGVYQYMNVPESVHARLMNAPSIGSFFSREIRDKYRTLKIK